MTIRHIAYFDESGDHGLEKIDPTFPAFVLCGCVYERAEYLKAEIPAFSAIKFAHFGHDAIVMHSYTIRKRVGPFKFLQDDKERERFMTEISGFFAASKARLIAAGIDKTRHKNQYKIPDDPYEIALLFCLERLYGHMKDCGTHGNEVVCVFEMRGDVEDAKLAKVFRTVAGGANQWGCKLPFRMEFADKKQNLPGLQIADLAAYPIARHVIDKNAANPAFDVIRPLFRTSPSGKIEGWGLKIFP